MQLCIPNAQLHVLEAECGQTLSLLAKDGWADDYT